MKKLLLIICLFFSLPCFSMEKLTQETLTTIDEQTLINMMINQEKELDKSQNFQEDFNIFFLNLVTVGKVLETRIYEDVVEKTYPYSVYRNTDLFLKGIYDWTFTVPNTIYLQKKYKRKLSKEWNTCLTIYNSKNFMNIHSNTLLNNIDDFFKEYKTLIYLENVPKDIIHYGIIEYEWYINNHMFEDQSHLFHHYSY